MSNKNQTYSGKSIARQLLQDTWVGRLLYGKPETYTDGYGTERKDVEFKESANGQQAQRMKETVTSAGRTVAENLWDLPMDVYSGIESGINGDWAGVGLAAGSIFLPQIAEGVAKQIIKNDDLINQIKKAAGNSDSSFEEVGKNARSSMRTVSGNDQIIDQLSDQELGWLINQRNLQLNNAPKGTRAAVLYRSDVNPDELSKIEIIDDSGSIGELIPDYNNAVSGTVSVGHIENIGGVDAHNNKLKTGVSEDAYNALMLSTGKPMSAGLAWKSPEATSRVYAKFNQDLPADETLVADWPFNEVLYNPEVRERALQQLGISHLPIKEQDVLLNDNINLLINSGQMRWPMQQPRQILSGPNKYIVRKNKSVFKITPDNISNGQPVIRWDLDDELLKQGGQLPKFQFGGSIPTYLKYFNYGK